MASHLGSVGRSAVAFWAGYTGTSRRFACARRSDRSGSRATNRGRDQARSDGRGQNVCRAVSGRRRDHSPWRNLDGHRRQCRCPARPRVARSNPACVAVAAEIAGEPDRTVGGCTHYGLYAFAACRTNDDRLPAGSIRARPPDRLCRDQPGARRNSRQRFQRRGGPAEARSAVQ